MRALTFHQSRFFTFSGTLHPTVGFHICRQRKQRHRCYISFNRFNRNSHFASPTSCIICCCRVEDKKINYNLWQGSTILLSIGKSGVIGSSIKDWSVLPLLLGDPLPDLTMQSMAYGTVLECPHNTEQKQVTKGHFLCYRNKLKSTHLKSFIATNKTNIILLKSKKVNEKEPEYTPSLEQGVRGAIILQIWVWWLSFEC